MKYKKHMIILLAAIFLFAMATASATDSNDTAVAVEDRQLTDEIIQASENQENTIHASNNDEVNLSEDDSGKLAISNDKKLGKTVTEHTFKAIQNAIDDGESTIYLEPGTYTGDNSIDIFQKSNIKIIGDSTILDAKGQRQIFNIQESSNITIQNIIFKNGYNDHGGGGAIFGSNGCNYCSISNCTFINNTAITGGAVGFGICSKCTVTNSNFINNTAFNYGGAVYVLYGWECTVTDCNFTYNTATGGGGAIRMYSGTVSNCNFTYNTATDVGGAVYSFDNVAVINCNFVNNTASEGGAINMDSGTVSICNFVDNKATGDYSYGGAIYIYSGTVTNCNFTGNNATTGSAIYFLSSSDPKTVFNSRFLNNRANAEALEITKNDNNITITFTGGNNLLNAIYSPDEVTFTNVAYWGANGIATVSATMSGSNKAAGQNITVGVVVNGKVVLNEVNVTDDNGMIVLPIIAGENYYISARHDTDSYYTEAEKTISNNTKFNVNVTSQTTHNKTVNITAKSNIPQDVVQGKLLFILPNGTEINATYGTNGTWWAVHKFADYGVYQVNAKYDGLDNVAVNKGTIAVTGPEHTFSFLNYKINGNDNSVIELSNDFYFDPDYDTAFVNGIVINRPVTIKGNGNAIDAKRQARIFYVQSANAVLENLTLKNAHSNSEGGAVYFLDQGTVSNCNFTGNSANEHGGAVYFYKGTGSVTNCNFTNNTASGDDACGGAVFFWDPGTVTNCNLTGNTASGYGGAVYILDTGEVTKCNFTDNRAYIGGAICMDSGTVSNCNFTNNIVSGDGGAIYLYSSDGNVVNCNFTGNNATTGSAIYFLSTSATKTVSNSTFLNNRANATALDIVKNDNNITITFTGKNNLLNAIYSNAEVTFTNVTYWGAKGITTVSSTMSGTNKAAGQKITVGIVVNGILVLNEVNVTDKNGMIVLPIKIESENYYIGARHDKDSYYTEAEKTISNNMKFSVNVTSQTANNRTVNITAKSDIYGNFMPGKLLFILPNGTQIEATYGANGTWWAEHTFDAYGEYKINATYVGLDNVTINNGTITINKVNSTITLENIVLDYGETKNVTVTTTGATGITAKIDGNNVTVINNYTIQIPVLDAGTYNLTVTTIPDDDHNPVTKEVNITVNKVNSTLTVNDIVFDYGSSGSTVVSLTGADGVNATVVGQPKTVVKVNGTNITVSDLDAGTYTLTVTTIADKNHNNITKNATITVNKVNATLTVNDVVLDYGETKNITVTTEGATGITAKIDGANVTVNGYTIPISGLSAGNYTLTVTTIPDENHNPVNVTSKITVNKVESTLNVDDIVFDYDGEGSGDVSFTGASEVTANVVNQPSAVISISGNKISVSGLAAGTYTLNVTTVPDENHTAVTETATITVNKINSTLTLDDVVLDYGESKNITVTTEGATGITAKIDGVNVTVNNYTIPISGLSAGNYTLTVTTIADANHNNITKNATITVNKVNATLTVNDVVLDYGETKNITVTTEGATGITAKIDGANVTVNGYTIPISGLSAGNYTLTVTTIADKNHNPVTKEVNITVNKLSTEIILANETLDLKVGDEVPVLANLTPAGAGNLTFTSSNEDLVFVEDNVTIVANSQGQAIITVSFAGNENYTAAENKTITVNVALNNASASVENDTLNLKVDETSAINATIEPDTIMLKIKYTSSNESVATVNKNGIVTAVGEGRAIITLEVGDDEIYAKKSTTVTVTVNKINTTADVSIPENITVGDNSTVNVILPADAKGNVTVKVDGEVVDTVPVKDGNADVTIPSMSAGNHTVEIAYFGDGKYNPVNETKDITVSKNDITPEIIIPSDIEFGDNATVDIKLPGDASGNVTLTVDGREINTVPVTNGTASVKLPALDAGNHTAEIAYSGDDKYNSVSKTATISVGKDSTNLSAANVTATYKVNKYLVIKLTDSQGNPLANSTVTVDLNGAKNYTTDENGQVKVKVSNLVPKTYTAKISFAGNDNYLGSEATAKVVVKKATPKITAKAKTFKTTTKTKKYTITLKDNTGKAIKNAKVTLKVNGKTYKATTNSKGKATFKITKLNKKGTFKATITYTGNKYYNKVTKKANIKVISSWKTISKGSKDKSAVREIQQALKNHGYYLTAYGHYLMVDGVYADCTVRSVKEFQHDKGLKVTGKVDENTAKKLGLI